MRATLSIVPLMLMGFIGMSFAEPLDSINTEVLQMDDSNVSLRISWNHDSSVAQYEIGCVSCMPNTAQTTIHDYVSLQNISTLDDGHAILYVMALDGDNKIIAAQQIFLLLK